MAKPNKQDKLYQDLANRMAVHCVRNTVIEDYHADGKLSDSDMKAFNKEVVNKIYTMLQILLKPEYEAFRDSPGFNRLYWRDDDWDPAELDPDLIGAIEMWMQHEASGDSNGSGSSK